VLVQELRKDHKPIRKELHVIFCAASLEDALAAPDRSPSALAGSVPVRAKCRRSASDWSTFFRFAQQHWKRLWTSFTLERIFKDMCWRMQVIARFPNESAAVVGVGRPQRRVYEWNRG